MLLRRILIPSTVLGLLASAPAPAQSLPPPVDRKIDFTRDVDPLLERRCYGCHGDEAVMNGYSLWRSKDAIRGGYSGKPAITRGDSANSRMIRMVAGLEENMLMPPAGGKLTDEEIGVLRAWIDQGLAWGQGRGDVDPKAGEEWLAMDYGPVISASITVREPGDPRADKGPDDNVVYKAHAVSLTPDNRAGVVFDTELLRYSVGWTGGFLELTGTVFDWKHGPHPYVDGAPVFETPVEPGWARDGAFADPRAGGFGKLPQDWAEYGGYYVHGRRIVFEYSIGGTRVLDSPGYREADGLGIVTRQLELEPGEDELLLQVAGTTETPRRVAESVVRAGDLLIGLAGRGELVLTADRVRLRLPPSDDTRRAALWFGRAGGAGARAFWRAVAGARAEDSLAALTKGGPTRFAQTVAASGTLGSGSGPYVVDEIGLPDDNPWKSWMRPGDFDFFPGEDRAVMTTWSGDVWIVDGVDGDLDRLEWKRYATGFNQPQGVEAVDGVVYVLDRNQITRLHDLNGDGEADYYESFNNDFLVTHHFHEFTFDLDRGPDGAFYFAKAARHALPAKVDHHGVIFKLDAEGENLEVVCRGFRVPNGVAVGPNGEITTSDQEGHWIPSTPVVLCEPGGYYGYPWGGGVGPDAVERYDRPIAYLPISVDNSGAGQAWVPDGRWGPLEGHLVHSSFGRGKIFVVLMEKVDGQVQGGAYELPVDFDTGLMRPDFREDDGQLYITGLYGWGSKKKAPGGFYRVRYTGEDACLPIELHVSKRDGMAIRFTQPLDRATAEDVSRYQVRRWNYKRTSRYGSDLFRLDGEQGTEEVEVRAARLSRDGATVLLELEDLREVDQMQVSFELKAIDGAPVRYEISNTVNKLEQRPGRRFLGAR